MPKPDRTTTNQYTIQATVIDGTIRLSGDIVGNTIEVPRGENGAVTIVDTAEYYLYASANGEGGDVAGCWGRVKGATGGAENTFDQVISDTNNIVYAVSKTSSADVSYGPVITVKPKG